ncbi:Transcriptional repressor of aga operon [Acidisarcina polymorpha]|uniref:Transcriptional repressor of aga operon n=1 Tax=Acidisarcina polymorpha TaxID=2211140 RepID=A0A2Z5G0X1_9BACT|nr:transcriptional repressor AgaR [Acidisarcina polymorpha]AXC12650.1 Transcriptional repressor of aga operon [Acidisarcina polymorpha]
MARPAENHSTEPTQLLIDERRQHILSLIENEGRVLVGELSRELGISQITIRKDLEYLRSKGLLHRTHGGALRMQASALFDPSLQEKQQQHSQEKQRIAVAAAKMVEEEQCVILDSGTTTSAIAQELKKFSQLTVITNAVNIATDLASSDLEVILIGGSFRKNSFSLVGPLAEDVLQEMHADILFLGVDGFDTEVGLTTPNLLEARVNRAMVKASRRVVAVCDSTKFERRSLSRIVPPSAIHCVITDRDLPAETAESLRSQNIEVVLV